jgi:hypothetical protein
MRGLQGHTLGYPFLPLVRSLQVVSETFWGFIGFKRKEQTDT